MSRKYRNEWERQPEFSGWLSAFTGDDTRAFCTLCKCPLQAQKKDIRNHGKCKKHTDAVKRVDIINSSKKITQFVNQPISEKRKIAELKIAAFISEHCSVSAVDHLGSLIKNLDDSSAVLSDIKLHRTKCSALINNVIAPCMLEDLIMDVGNSYFSVIVDESTAVDNTKMLCLMLRYFSKSQKRIITTFYRLIELEAGDASSLATVFMSQLSSDGLKIEHLVGIGVDGANVMIGVNHSFSSILKNTVPELVVVKCLCHSLHLAAEHASRVLPRSLDFLVKECHNWFSASSKRQIEYNALYATLAENKPLKIDKLSGTRWLARYEAICKIVEQWDVLKLHFSLVKDKERCYTAEQLHSMLSCKANFTYLVLLRHILKPVTIVNKSFQVENPNPLKLLQDLHSLFIHILQMLVPPRRLEQLSKSDLSNFKFKEFLIGSDCINFGYAFMEASREVSSEELKLIKERCHKYLIHLCEELQRRLPENMALLQQINKLSPQAATSQVKPDITDLVVGFKNVCESVDDALNEWNILHVHQWKQLSTPEEFWAEVFEAKNAIGEYSFSNISRLALSVLSLPFSNAAVERAFSLVNIIKSKLRNRMAISMAESILRVRFNVQSGDCINFRPTQKMLMKFTSEEMYVIQDKNSAEVLDAFPSD